MSTISEDKKHVLLNHINQLESQLSELFHLLEEDQDIPEEQFRVYEKRIESLQSIYKEIYEEVYFT